MEKNRQNLMKMFEHVYDQLSVTERKRFFEAHEFILKVYQFVIDQKEKKGSRTR
ncbi:MAG: hypothetical protein AB7F43_09330 [Bacteriovoracia bacterium]